MIKRRIPHNFEFNAMDILEILRQLHPDASAEVNGRIITIHKDLTGQELQALKTAILPTLTDITDITI